MADAHGGGAAPVVKAPSVTLSTVHAAKGMEWDVVFVVGVEENLFPHARSVLPDEGGTERSDGAFEEVNVQADVCVCGWGEGGLSERMCGTA